MLHLNNYQNRHDLLIDWILDSMPKGGSVLDIGANDGSFCPEVRRIVEHAGIYAGVDPDRDKLIRNPFVTTRYFSTLEEAQIPASTFDCAFAIYVLEHVARERQFVEAVSRVLKPGGSFFFITPNGNHYFAAIAGALAKIGIQSHVRRLIRPRQVVGKYHYPALYRLNTPRVLQYLGSPLGLSNQEYRYCEKIEEFECYFPSITRVLPWGWERLAAAFNSERMLGNFMGRLIKCVDTA